MTMYYRTYPGKTQIVAEAKREPFVSLDEPLLEPGDVWCEFGHSEEQAIKQLIDSLVHDGVIT